MSQTGTRRMLWLLTLSNIDPFTICKYLRGKEAQIMHRRFTDVITTWSQNQ